MNLPTLIVGLVILAAVLGVVVKGVRDRKNGKFGCSCGCGGCAMNGTCHSKRDQ